MKLCENSLFVPEMAQNGPYLAHIGTIWGIIALILMKIANVSVIFDILRF